VLFDEIKVKTITHDDELYVNVEQLYQHLAGSTQEFSKETYQMAQKFGITADEKYFVIGMVQGMWSVVLMLKHGDQEFKFESIETVDDLVKKFWNENGSEG
jgi:hypothetical protein